MNTETKLRDSLRAWILNELPISQDDIDLQNHLTSLDDHGLLIAFLNWRSRLITPKPRTVHYSATLKSNPDFNQHGDALSAIIADMEQGAPLRKYLSRGTRFAVSLPQNGSDLQSRADLDLLLNDWKMHHFHLSTEIDTDGYVQRTGPLLFAVVFPDEVYLVDIMDHGNWTNRHLLEVVVRDFPGSRCFDVMKGVVGLSHEPTEEEYRKLRRNGINTAFMIDGKAIVPAGGMVTAGMTFVVTRQADTLLENLIAFSNSWDSDPEAVRGYLLKSGAQLSSDPEFKFMVTEDGRPVVIDSNTNAVIALANNLTI